MSVDARLLLHWSALRGSRIDTIIFASPSVKRQRHSFVISGCVSTGSRGPSDRLTSQFEGRFARDLPLHLGAVDRNAFGGLQAELHPISVN